MSWQPAIYSSFQTKFLYVMTFEANIDCFHGSPLERKKIMTYQCGLPIISLYMNAMYYVCYSTDAFTSLEIVFLDAQILQAVGVSNSIWWINLILFIVCWIWPVFIIQKNEYNMYHYTKKIILYIILYIHSLHFQNKYEVYNDNQLYLCNFWGQQWCLMSTLWPVTSGQWCCFPAYDVTSFPSLRTPLFPSIWWFWKQHKLSICEMLRNSKMFRES